MGIIKNFNPHSREGSDLPASIYRQFRLISIHTPAKGVTYFVLVTVTDYGDFNPHSREGSDYLEPWKEKRVSDFNPHSREGSDNLTRRIRSCLRNFNPHSREGSDGITDDWAVFRSISIHTPAKGVTQLLPILAVVAGDFNPHSREGSDGMTNAKNRE